MEYRPCLYSPRQPSYTPSNKCPLLFDKTARHKNPSSHTAIQHGRAVGRASEYTKTRHRGLVWVPLLFPSSHKDRRHLTPQSRPPRQEEPGRPQTHPRSPVRPSASPALTRTRGRKARAARQSGRRRREQTSRGEQQRRTKEQKLNVQPTRIRFEKSETTPDSLHLRGGTDGTRTPISHYPFV